MNINITGKHMDLGESFQNHVEARLSESISKYLDRVNQLDVVATKQGNRVRVDIHANTGTNSHVTVNSQGEADDAYAAFDTAAVKAEKQLRRYKRRLTNHHKTRQSSSEVFQAISAKSYVLCAQDQHEELPEDDAPVIVAERQMEVETLTVSEAVMKMDLANLPALMFYNSAHGRVNLVYRRNDGNVAWVDPEDQAVQAA